MTDSRIQMTTPFSRDDRGVSEVLAFVLVFGIILSSVTILSVTGFQALEGYQEVEQQRNADRAMLTLADNFNDVLRYDGVEERYGELAVRGGTIAIDEDGGAKINIDVEPGSGEFDDKTITLGSFTYESGGDTISYEGGAVIREAESGGVVLSEPHLRYNADRDVAIVSLVKITGDSRSIKSDGSQGFTISVTDRTTEVYPGDDVTITAVDQDPHDVWEEDILQDGGWNGGNDADRILVTVVEVEINY